MYDARSESSQFESEVARINNWGRSLRPVYFILGVLALGFCAFAKANKEYETYPPWVLCSALCLLFAIHGLSLLLQRSAILNLYHFSELSDLPRDSDDCQMWNERAATALRGFLFYGPAALAILFGILVEFVSLRNGLPALWFGALPAAAMFFFLAKKLHDGEVEAEPRNREISARLQARERSKAGKEAPS